MVGVKVDDCVEDRRPEARNLRSHSSEAEERGVTVLPAVLDDSQGT